MAAFLLLAIFGLTIIYKIQLKMCSNVMEPAVVPLFISLWVLIGIALTFPVFGSLWFEAWNVLRLHPFLLLLCILKGVVIYFSFFPSQRLMKSSMSTHLYVWPIALGLVAIINAFIGENLTPVQWVSVAGVCLLSAGFFFYGHARDLNAQDRRLYFSLTGFCILLAVLDQYVLRFVNWYAYLTIFYGVALVLSLINHRGHIGRIKRAVFNRMAIISGATFAFVELLKYYQFITYNSVTVTILVQNMATPVLLILSALVWKERTLKEQFIWGILALALSLPLFLR